MTKAEYIESLKNMSDLDLYTALKEEWSKEDLMDYVEEGMEDDVKIDRSLTYQEFVSIYRKDVIDTIEDVVSSI